MKAPQGFVRLVLKQSQYRKHIRNDVITWFFLLFCYITSVYVLKLRFKHQCVFEGVLAFAWGKKVSINSRV